MKRIIAGVFFAFSSLYTCNAMAEREAFTITVVGVDLAQQGFFAEITPASTSTPCVHKSELRWNLADPGTKEVISLLLSARALGKRIQVGIASTCVANRATGTYLYIEQ